MHTYLCVGNDDTVLIINTFITITAQLTFVYVEYWDGGCKDEVIREET